MGFSSLVYITMLGFTFSLANFKPKLPLPIGKLNCSAKTMILAKLLWFYFGNQFDNYSTGFHALLVAKAPDQLVPDHLVPDQEPELHI